jgi:hypothetical protein
VDSLIVIAARPILAAALFFVFSTRSLLRAYARQKQSANKP